MDAPTPKTVVMMPSFTGDESDVCIKTKPMRNSDDDSFSDNDIEIEETFRDRPNQMPSKPFVKIIEQSSKTDHILAKAKKPTPQPAPQKQQKKPPPQQKKRAGSEMKAKVYSMEMPHSNGGADDDEQVTSVQTAITALKDGFDFTAVDRTPQFYNAERIGQIHAFLDTVIMHIKNNPYYTFAAETATSIGKGNETFFIHSTVQEIIRIITANGKLNGVMSNYTKRFEMYSSQIKFMMSAIKTLGDVPASLLQSSTESDQILADQLSTISESQKMIQESFRNIKNIQNEMEIINRIVVHANIYLSSRFYFSSSLNSLINTAMNEIHNTTDADGLLDPRRYSPDLIIRLRPELRNQLAQLCSYVYNRNIIGTGNRYVSDREARRNLASIQNMAIIMKNALRQDNEMLDQPLPIQYPETPYAITPASTYASPQLIQTPQESVFETPRSYQSLTSPTIMTPPQMLEYGSQMESMFFMPTPRTPRASGKKKRQLYVPEKYVKF